MDDIWLALEPRPSTPFTLLWLEVKYPSVVLGFSVWIVLIAYRLNCTLTRHICKGSHIARTLAASSASYRIQLCSRSPSALHQNLTKTLPTKSSCTLMPPQVIDITDPRTLKPALDQSDIVISLVGLMNGTPNQFEDIQWRGAENVARAAKENGAKLIHVSAIGADVNSKLPYARTKGLGEQAVLSECPDATILRPSLVFGPEDDFFNVSLEIVRNTLCTLD